MDDHTAYRSAELAAVYDAVYADWTDVAFWQWTAAAADDGPLLELGCGTGRVLIPLARDGHEVTGLDLSTHMLARCRAKLQAEPPEVRRRVTLVAADIASFDLDRRFAQIYCSCGTFHHLSTAEQQLACLERCNQHLTGHGTLVLDLFNPVPTHSTHSSDAGEPAGGSATAGVIDWTEGRRIRSRATVFDCDGAQPANECEITHEILEPDGTVSTLIEAFPMRFVFRHEIEHLLARAGFGVVALYGDHDRSPYSGESPGMIVVAKPMANPESAAD